MEVQEYIDAKLCHSVHTSERRAFRSCRRRWNWSYKDMYYPKVTPAPLEFGVSFHLAMEFYYRPETWHDKETAAALAIAAFQNSCRTQYRSYIDMNGEPSWEIIQDYRDRVDLGINMLKYYFTVVAPQYDSMWTPIEVEVAFEVPIKNPDTGEQLWCKCDRCWKKWINLEIGKVDQEICRTTHCKDRQFDEDDYRDSHWRGLPVTYGGRLDALFQDEHGRFFIVDWKSTSRILDEGKEASFLQLDDQISSYCWALWVLGIDVAGFVYVEFKKAYPKPPEKLAKLYKGKAYSTSKQNMTTAQMVTTTVTAYDPDAYGIGLYDEYLQWLELEGPKFTQRHQINRNENELANIGKNLAYEVMDMVDSPRIYPQPGRFSCPTCLFQQPCVSMNDGSDHQYLLENLFEKRELHYYETRELSTE